MLRLHLSWRAPFQVEALEVSTTSSLVEKDTPGKHSAFQLLGAAEITQSGDPTTAEEWKGGEDIDDE